MDKHQLKTGLSDQQRDQYAKLLRDLAKHAVNSAHALETDNKDELLENFLIVSLMAGSIQSLSDLMIKVVLISESSGL